MEDTNDNDEAIEGDVDEQEDDIKEITNCVDKCNALINLNQKNIHLAFVKKNNTWNGQIDILPFISYLVENNHISSNDYLVDIEFGNEIWAGTGLLELTDYNITIE